MHAAQLGLQYLNHHTCPPDDEYNTYEKNHYTVPLICSEDGCIMDVDNIKKNGRAHNTDSDVDLIPGDVIEFKLDKSAEPYAIVVTLEEELITKASRYLRVRKEEPQSIKIRRRPAGEEAVSLSFLIYSPSCGCSYPVESMYEGMDTRGFHVGPPKKKKPPRPRSKRKSSAKKARRRR